MAQNEHHGVYDVNTILQFYFVVFIAHVIPFYIVVWRANATLADEDHPGHISWSCNTPRSIANLWRLLFGMRFVRSGDRSLIVAGTIHIFTTATLALCLICVLSQ